MGSIRVFRPRMYEGDAVVKEGRQMLRCNRGEPRRGDYSCINGGKGKIRRIGSVSKKRNITKDEEKMEKLETLRCMAFVGIVFPSLSVLSSALNDLNHPHALAIRFKKRYLKEANATGGKSKIRKRPCGRKGLNRRSPHSRSSHSQ